MIVKEGDRYLVQGAVTIANARALLEESAALFQKDGLLTVDFAAVDEVDSSAVSLMLEWARQAQRAGRPLRFLNLHANLKSLCALYGVTELIPAE